MEKDPARQKTRIPANAAWGPPLVHASAWERLYGAWHRDWEQTKADLRLTPNNLHHTALDTVRQALGRAHPPLQS